MGRTKTFDRSEKLDLAVALFHRSGFAATSTADLVDHLGINRKSMYAEFGGKQEMFEAALTRYFDVQFIDNFGYLETPTAGLPEVNQLLVQLGDSARGEPAGLGCLLCNTAIERAPNDPASRDHVHNYVERISAAVLNALTNAKASGVLKKSVDIEAEARFFTSHVFGQLTLIRANVAPDIVESATATTQQHLRSLADNTNKI